MAARFLFICMLLVDILSAQQTNLTLTVTPDNARICAGSTIVLNVSGASSYTWSPSIGLSGTGNGSTVAASPMATTTYTIYGASGTSSGSITVTVIVGSSLSIDISPKNPTICPTQSVVLTALSAATSYTWMPVSGLSSSSGHTVNASPGTTQTYTINGSDASGCTGTDTITVHVSPPPAASAGNTQSITCTNTLLTLSGSGGVSYAWTGPGITSGSNTANPTVNQPGDYHVTVTSAAGCTATSSVHIAQNTSPPLVSIPNTETLTCNPHSVVLSATVSPSTVSYSWTGPGIPGSATSPSVTVNQPGIYQVLVTNTVNGCPASGTSTVVNAPGVPSATIVPVAGSSHTITCAHPTVSLTVITSPATGVTYTWSTGTNNATTTVTSPTVVTLLVNNASSGCTILTQYTVTGNTTSPTLTVADTSIHCGAHSVVLSAVCTATDVSYAWTGPGPGSILGGGATPTPTVSSAGSYTVTVTNNSNGCSTSSVVTVTGNHLQALFTANPVTGFPPLTVNFTNNSTGATSYQWSFGTGSASTANDPSYVYANKGTYTVMLVAANGNCHDTAYTVITVQDPYKIDVPNVFTPNGDGKNDLFTISAQGLKEISLTIYNRWGMVVYDATEQNPAWDGSVKGGGKADEGTYFYVVNATAYNGDKIERRGTVQVFR